MPGTAGTLTYRMGHRYGDVAMLRVAMLRVAMLRVAMLRVPMLRARLQNLAVLRGPEAARDVLLAIGTRRARPRPRCSRDRLQVPKFYTEALHHSPGEWCNRQHATLWMSNLGFESLFPSFLRRRLEAPPVYRLRSP